jgi:hypothetical protein
VPGTVRLYRTWRGKKAKPADLPKIARGGGS